MKNKKKKGLSETRVELYKEKKRKVSGFIIDEVSRLNDDAKTSIDHPALSDKEIKHAIRSRVKHSKMLKSSGDPLTDYEEYASCLMGSITMGAIREFTYNFCRDLLDPKYLDPLNVEENIPLIRSAILDILANKPSPYPILTNVICCQFDQDLIDRIDDLIHSIIDNEVFTTVNNESTSSDAAATNPKDADNHEETMKISEVSKQLNIHPKTIYNWIKAGKVTAYGSLDGKTTVYVSEVKKCAEEKHYKRNPYKPRKKSSSGGEYKSNTGMKN